MKKGAKKKAEKRCMAGVAPKTKRRNGKPLRALSPGHFDCLLFDFDGDHKAKIVLPFVPYPGLQIQVPFRRQAYGKIGEVFWNGTTGKFEIFLEEVAE